MPSWFEIPESESDMEMVPNNLEDQTESPGDKYFPYRDNKHTIFQVQLLALADTEVIFAAELLHGQWRTAFEEQIIGTADISVHTPNKANVLDPSELVTDRYTFLAQLESEELDSNGMEMPLNMPIT